MRQLLIGAVALSTITHAYAIQGWEFEGRVRETVEQFRIEKNAVGITVAIGIGDRVVFSDGFGFLDKTAGKSSRYDALNRLASVSKPLAAILTLKLHEARRINIAEPVSSVLGANLSKTSFTFRDLLCHQSGIGHYAQMSNPIDLDRSFETLREPTAWILGNPRVGKPGEKFHYSTHAYTVLGSALEKRTQTSFAELLRQYISAPYRLDSLNIEDRQAFASHRNSLYSVSQGKLSEPTPDQISWKAPGGGLEMSAHDLCRFGLQLVNGRVLSAASMNHMFTKQRTSDGKETNYGLGWSVSNGQGRLLADHGGSQPGSSTYWRVIPNDKVVIVVFCNTSGVPASELANQLTAILDKK